MVQRAETVCGSSSDRYTPSAWISAISNWRSAVANAPQVDPGPSVVSGRAGDQRRSAHTFDGAGGSVANSPAAAPVKPANTAVSVTIPASRLRRRIVFACLVPETLR